VFENNRLPARNKLKKNITLPTCKKRDVEEEPIGEEVVR
jgi:hypothetical protein